MSEDDRESWQDIANEFYMRVGECVTAWAEVEAELFRIFHYCVGPLTQCAIIYYRTPGLDPRFGLTDEIVKSILPKKKPGEKDDPAVKAWKDAKGDYQDLLADRRRVVHQPVKFREGGDILTVGDLYNTPDILDAAVPWFEIATSEEEALRDKPKAKTRPLTTEDLLAHKVAVIGLKDRLRQFYADVLTKHPGGPAQHTPPPSPG